MVICPYTGKVCIEPAGYGSDYCEFHCDKNPYKDKNGETGKNNVNN